MKVLMMVFFCVFNAWIFAQDVKAHQVPLNVKATFEAKYPNMIVYEWEFKRKLNYYEAEFFMHGRKYEMHISVTGEWILTESDIDPENLPIEVQVAIGKSEYAMWNIDDVEELSTPNFTTVYELTFKKEKQTIQVYYLPTGERIENYNR